MRGTLDGGGACLRASGFPVSAVVLLQPSTAAGTRSGELGLGGVELPLDFMHLGTGPR